METPWDARISQLENKQHGSGGRLEGLNTRELGELGRIKERRDAYIRGYRAALADQKKGAING